MTGLSALLAGPWGAAVAVFGMTLVTYLCRASGVVLMSRIRITPRVERALRALPGSIVVATILPLGIDGGPAAVAGLAAAILAMGLVRVELVAISVGLGIVTLLRAVGP
jgi:uncharacterized membrane protein